jgi:hypothetical protein
MIPPEKDPRVLTKIAMGKAITDARFLALNLTAALHTASTTESLILLDIIGSVTKIERRISTLRSAVILDDKGNVD